MARMDEKGLRVGIVVTRWNEWVTKALLEGAQEELAAAGASVRVVQVPGAWEVPLAAAGLIQSGKVDAIVALGCILQGQTAHAGLLASDVASALMKLQVEHRTPISWGILTVETAEQAMDRAGLKHGNKGREAAQAALTMVEVLRQLQD